MQTLEQLVDELGIQEMTEARFENERARLAKRFLRLYGVLAFEEIDEMICSNKVQTNDLVQQWINLHALRPYIARTRAQPKPPPNVGPTSDTTGREDAARSVFGTR